MWASFRVFDPLPTVRQFNATLFNLLSAYKNVFTLATEQFKKRIMRFRPIGILLCGMLAAFVFGSCNVDKQIKELQKTVDQLAIAVPGERLLRLIDYTNGAGTDEQKKAAQAYIKSVFKIDLAKGYELSVTYSFDTSKAQHLRADVFVGATPDLAEVKNYVQNALNVHVIASNAPIPMTENEIWSAIDKKLRANLLLINAAKYPVVGFGHMPESAVAVGTTSSDNYDVNSFVNNLVDAIFTVRGINQFPLTNIITHPFNPLQGLDYAFVLINKEDFDKVTAGSSADKFTVSLIVREKDPPKNPLFDPNPFKFSERDFASGDQQIVHHASQGDWVWTYKQVTPYSGLTEKVLQDLQQRKHLATEFNKQQGH